MLNLIDCLFFGVILMLVLFYVCFTFIFVCEFCILGCDKIWGFSFSVCLLSYSLFVRVNIHILFLYLFTCLSTFFGSLVDKKAAFRTADFLFLNLFLVLFKCFVYYVCGLFCFFMFFVYFVYFCGGRGRGGRGEVRIFLYLFMSPPPITFFFSLCSVFNFCGPFFYLSFCFVLIILGFCSYLYLWVVPFNYIVFFI